MHAPRGRERVLSSSRRGLGGPQRVSESAVGRLRDGVIRDESPTPRGNPNLYAHYRQASMGEPTNRLKSLPPGPRQLVAGTKCGREEMWRHIVLRCMHSGSAHLEFTVLQAELPC
jgi:hypothetical protein